MKRCVISIALAISLQCLTGCGGGSAPATAGAPGGAGSESGSAVTDGSAANSTPVEPTVAVGPAAGSPQAVGNSAQATPVVLPVTPGSSPDEVVMAFLNSMRDGNSGIAEALLSDQARAETARHQWPIQPPGAPSATYQLGEAAYADAEKTVAHVGCVWSEPDGAGGNLQFEVTWALRRLDQGWRVAGFATEVVAGKPHYFFNFEDIANLKETQAQAEAAMAEATAASEVPAGEVAGRPAGETRSR